MKQCTRFLLFAIMVLCSLAAGAQKYKSVADTGKLNLEYVKVSNDIAELTADVRAAEEKLPIYQSKAREAASDADNAAYSSKDNAAKATNGDLGDAKDAKKKADKAYNRAKDAKKANEEVADQEKKIAKLNGKIIKKQERLEELVKMRAAIFEKM